MGPTVEAQRRVVRFKLLRHLEAQGDRTIIKFAHREENVERDAINRSSIVTVFRRVDLNFNMLFTGDAHDRDSDIRSRISQYLGQEIRIDVLKIPHHGSNVTTDTGFYHDVRASVYLVCASPSMHGNPRFSTLRAIIEGFRGKAVGILQLALGETSLTAAIRGSGYQSPGALSHLLLRSQDNLTRSSTARRSELWRQLELECWPYRADLASSRTQAYRS